MNILRASFLSVPRFFHQSYQISYLALFFTTNDRLQMARGKTKLAAIANGGRSQNKLPDDDSIKERTRGYQMEMFEESLKRNIIVAV